jgi:hypothetical protein
MWNSAPKLCCWLPLVADTSTYFIQSVHLPPPLHPIVDREEAARLSLRSTELLFPYSMIAIIPSTHLRCQTYLATLSTLLRDVLTINFSRSYRECLREHQKQAGKPAQQAQQQAGGQGKQALTGINQECYRVSTTIPLHPFIHSLPRYPFILFSRVPSKRSPFCFLLLRLDPSSSERVNDRFLFACVLFPWRREASKQETDETESRSPIVDTAVLLHYYCCCGRLLLRASTTSTVRFLVSCG